MNKRSTFFLLLLVTLVLMYLYAVNKMVIYNHSKQVVNKVTVTSEFTQKTFKDVPDNEVMKFTFFAPFDKKVKVKIEQPNQINTITFTLKGFFLGEQYNQIEITQTGEIKQGALGLE